MVEKGRIMVEKNMHVSRGTSTKGQKGRHTSQMCRNMPGRLLIVDLLSAFRIVFFFFVELVTDE
jgi:hypothetical protein